MAVQPLILVVDDMPDNVDIVQARLENLGYRVVTAGDGEEALIKIRQESPDLVLLDVMMPKLDGIETVKRLKADASLGFVPVILLTAKSDLKDVVAGLESGADDYLTKPIDHAALVARVRSMLRIKNLQKRLEDQARVLAEQSAELATWNRTLEERVATQVGEIERISRLKRFLAPQVADVVLSGGDDSLLRSHRREVVVLFCDLRGFTSFAESAEPEEVMAMLREYHGVLGPLVRQHEGTLDHFAGDSIMVFFNDPVPCRDPPAKAVALADAIRRGVGQLTGAWFRRGFQLGFGIGIAQGYATLGQVGFEDRMDYAAIGTVTNIAARLCADAQDGQILATRRVAAAVESIAESESVGSVALKGLSRPIEVYKVGRIISTNGADGRSA